MEVMLSIKPTMLYRTMDFSRVVQIFENKELYFVNPSVWDDPYEERIKHSKNHALFAQCWCQLGISDAMWRIYSQNGMGVRISTTKEKLESALKSLAREKNYKYRVRKVVYKSQKKFEVEAAKIAKELSQDFDIHRAVDMLYLKRDAFRHESEWRATLFFPNEKDIGGAKAIKLPIDPHSFIDRILLDPRAPDELVDAFKFYFKNKVKFRGEVVRSQLYKAPRQLKVEYDDISIEDL
ncbi:DUF2971 domain-containing protein [Pseudomonas koreensis]|uniref:DUF2971 domain-containing protein n=1 Tax=Pseudomonas koreensis TaxID=198620 RepID=UPI003D981DCE